MDHARISELLAPFLSRPGDQEQSSDPASLSSAQLGHISTYIDLLLRWNARINLTAVREPEEIVTRHFGESIFAAQRLFPGQWPKVDPAEAGSLADPVAPHLIDVGAGAGFPGLPIKIWVPHIRLTLIESNQKKATFMREAIRSLGLVGADVFHGRAEAYQGPKGDMVTLRAVERFESILPVAGDLVSPAGRLVIFLGLSQVQRVRELVPGLKWSEPIKIPLSESRIMILGSDDLSR